MRIWGSHVYRKGVLCFLIHKSYVRSIKYYCFVRKYAAIPVQLEIFSPVHYYYYYYYYYYYLKINVKSIEKLNNYERPGDRGQQNVEIEDKYFANSIWCIRNYYEGMIAAICWIVTQQVAVIS